MKVSIDVSDLCSQLVKYTSEYTFISFKLKEGSFQ